MRICTASLLFFMLLTISGGACACTEPTVPTFNQSLKTATSVFVFRITSIGLTNKAEGSTSIGGAIEIVDTLKGRPMFDYFLHTNPGCARLNLQLGEYYLAATSQNGSVLTIAPGDKSILGFTSDYLDRRPPPRGRPYRSEVLKAISGGKIRNELLRELSMFVYAFPPSPNE